MSADEDTELRDLVAQTLEANGVLGKIRAQLRASVFLALEEQDKVKNKSPLLNAELQKFLSTTEGCQVVSLVREFLQFFNLEYTLAVFDPEICCAPEKLDCGRSSLARAVNVVETPETSKLPLLSTVVRHYKGGDAAHGRRRSLTEDSDSGEDIKPEVNGTKYTGKSAAFDKNIPASKDAGGGDDDLDSDSFFDAFQKKEKPWEQKDDTKQVSPASKAANNSMSSLAGLPSLTGNSRINADTAENDKDKEKVLDLEFDDDKYDDDFQASNISAVGQTPRSARSDKNVKSIENDEIDEEIEEELSGADELLKSEMSANDDLTTDRTLSPTEQSQAADYIEDVLHT